MPELPTHTPLLAWILGLHTIRDLYAQTLASLGSDDAQRSASVAARFAGAALRALDISPTYHTPGSGIPANGPLIIAANHPHGALDGLLLLDAIGRVRPDVRLLANHLLARVPALRDLCFFVDPFAGTGAAARSLAGLRAAHLWLRRGGALVVFPAGEVAHELGIDGTVIDSPWQPTLGRLALANGAHTMPAFIAGGNSRLFRAAGRLHPRLRTALLPRELLKQRGHHAVVHFGTARPIAAAPPAADTPGAETVTAAVRAHLEELRTSASACRDTATKPWPQPGTDAVAGDCPPPTLASIAPPVPAARLIDDIRALPSSALLVSLGELHVYSATAAEMPAVLDEIARLREIAFRAAGEGTGRERDRDRFDDHYLHLFVWQATTNEVIGAYRLAPTDRIVRERGVGGLYTRSLFRYDERLLQSLPPAVELGRSFVRPEFQRTPAVLFLLWKGISAWIARHPEYRVLFGAVSISSRYHERTREMLMAFLEQHHLDTRRAALVAALDPVPPPRMTAAGVALPATVDEADRMVGDLEGTRMPVLLRHYLALNARLLGFNRDAAFGNAIDALMTVDLMNVEPRILRRYFGAAEARAVLAFHAAQATPDAA